MLEDRAFEKVRVHPGVQLDRVDEGEVAKILLVHEAVLDALVGLNRGVTQVSEIVMPHVVPKTALSRAPSGLRLESNASEVMRSSPSQPKKKFGTKRS